MKITRVREILLVSALLVGGAGCGSQPTMASISAGLIVPRALADDLAKVTVYLFETNVDKPHCEDLEDTTGFPTTYEDTEYKKVTIDFKAGQVAVIDNIPDRANVWRFYGRGFDASDTLIGQGCTVGLYTIEAGKDTQVTLELYAL